jgi:hypothetical protein
LQEFSSFRSTETLEETSFWFGNSEVSFAKNPESTNEVSQHRKKFTTGLVELAAVMATDKVSKKRQKLFRISYKKTPKLMQWFRQTKTLSYRLGC